MADDLVRGAILGQMLELLERTREKIAGVSDSVGSALLRAAAEALLGAAYGNSDPRRGELVQGLGDGREVIAEILLPQFPEHEQYVLEVPKELLPLVEAMRELGLADPGWDGVPIEVSG